MHDEQQDEFGDDDFGRKLAQSIKADEALLAGLVYDVGQRVEQAANGIGEMPNAFELAAIKKLQLQLENDKQFAEARLMTRKRRGKS